MPQVWRSEHSGYAQARRARLWQGAQLWLARFCLFCCLLCGRVPDVLVPLAACNDAMPSLSMQVFVEFKELAGAQQGFGALNNRKFGPHTVAAAFMPEDKFAARDLS